MPKFIAYLSVYRTLLTMIRSQKKFLVLAVICGSLGHIFATAIPSTAAYCASTIALDKAVDIMPFAVLIGGFALARAILKYVEQLCNHQVAFSTLALIRDSVFKKLRTLSPAKMEGRDKGELIAFVTSDIELLEVFYAHTLSPLLIACIHTLVYTYILLHYHMYYVILLMASHILLGVVFPLLSSHNSNIIGSVQRKALSKLNTSILDTFIGIDTCIQFGFGERRYAEINQKTLDLAKQTKKLAIRQSRNRTISSAIILIVNTLNMMLAAHLYLNDLVTLAGVVVPIVILTSSFGPVTALANLGNDLSLTYASGKRIVDLLNEVPAVIENTDGKNVEFSNISGQDINFSYDDEHVIKGIDFNIKKGDIVGVKGNSGAGKSTLLKLMMRFYDPDSGQIKMNNVPLNQINVHSLKKNIAYMTQHTHVISGTVLDNMRIAKREATLEEIREACQKASIDEFFMSLPEQYNTQIAKVKATLSHGEMQRLSLARAFLQGGDLLLLDEPTSNIDSLNEAVILKSLWKTSKDKSIVIVSHKESALKLANHQILIEREVS